MNRVYFKHLTVLFIIGFVFSVNISAQHNDTLNNRHLYKSRSVKLDTEKLDIQKDTSDRVFPVQDTLTQYQRDSIAAREKYIQDSIAARLQYIKDSIIAREKFVKDSILRRKRILDSVTFLRNELPRLLEASVRTISEEIIIYDTPVKIIGDSTLSNYNITYLIFGFNKPYIPWKTVFNLSDNPIDIKVDTVNKRIISVKAPDFHHFYEYKKRSKIIKITSKSILVNINGQRYFRAPVDSVFLDSKGRIFKIKRYHLFYSSTANYQRGSLKFSDLALVKQFQYTVNKKISNYKAIKFCERGNRNKPVGDVCNIMNFKVTKNGPQYSVIRNNTPENAYSDGTFIFTYGDNYTLKDVSFKNVNKTEDWKTFIEVNEEGNVIRYVYKNNGKINRTLLVKYNNNPGAKYKVETISCMFEDDGISYQQINNTTKKMRTRDRLTLEWSDWQ